MLKPYPTNKIPPMSPFRKGGIKGGFEKAMLKLP